MTSETSWDISPEIRPDENDDLVDDSVWASSEKAKIRALLLYLVQSIVERYGGTVDVDLANDTIKINVPKEKEVVCAQEIEEQVGRVCV